LGEMAALFSGTPVRCDAASQGDPSPLLTLA
jgi:hypothetical protein